MTGKSETSSKVKSSNYDLAANDMPGNLITQTQLKVRSTLLAADDVGGINKIYSSLIREERLRMGTKPNSERTDVMSFAVQSGGGNMSRNEPRLESKEASQWWPDRSKAPGRGSGRGRGSQRSAPFTRQGRGIFNAPRANVASNSIHPSATASTSKPALGDLEKSGLLGLTEDQWQLLKATFQEQTPTTSSMTEESRTPSSTEWPSINEAGNELPHSENPVLSDPSNTACENENEATCGTDDERLARDFLAVPASTVASESAFSSSGRLVSPHRNRLHPKTLEALMCAQSWLWAAEMQGEASTGYATIYNDVESEDSCITREYILPDRMFLNSSFESVTYHVSEAFSEELMHFSIS
ncbi:hypothetical protein POM88_002015 [Heracleum sosnowskyi]|uniref:HAT C-terminal dimerisation domain-containing protein n=1 Tax=Heracleum sosnowskyi TaxID=360622 RepID=A0AAD8JDC9_9APIA|nr:hypothetical protein POM88_002015 [Heracleum sosnowskyi]